MNESQGTMVTKKQLTDLYRECLAQVAQERPREYVWLLGLNDLAIERKIAEVAEKMVAAIIADTYNHDGLAMTLLHRKLGIARTYKAMREWLDANLEGRSK